MRWVQRALGLSLCVGVFFNQVALASCLDELKSADAVENPAEGLTKKKQSLPRILFRNGVGVFIDPYWFPIKVIRALKNGKDQSIWATRVEFTKNAARTLVGYLIYGLVPDRFVLSIVELHDETDEEFLKISKDEIIVVVDGFDKNSDLDSKRKVLVELLARERKREGYNVEYISPETAYDFAVKLNEIRRTRGPIARLDIYTHGVARGAISIQDDAIGYLSDYNFYPYLDSGLMKKGGVIRFNSCLVGRSESFLRRFGKALMPEGGKVFASKLITVPSGTAELTEYLSGKDMPPAIDQIQDFVLGKLFNFMWIAYIKTTSRNEDSLSPAWDPITEITID